MQYIFLASTSNFIMYRPLRQKTQCPVFNRKWVAAPVSTLLSSGNKHYKPYGELIRLLLILVITHDKQQYGLQLPGNPEGYRATLLERVCAAHTSTTVRHFWV